MKPKSKVFDHFTANTVDNKTTYTCCFCNFKYTFKNATRFAHHLRSCKKCPGDVKRTFEKNKQTTTPQESAGSSPPLLQETRNVHGEMDIHKAIARAVYVSGAPLSQLEHPLWKEALNILNPFYTAPSRKMLSTSLLDREYKETQETVAQIIHQADVLHLAIDGWSNIRNEPIINIMVYAPKPYFYKFIMSEDNRHTGDYLLQKTSEVLDEVGASKFFAVVSDNAANMIRCGELLKRTYGNITWIGCLAHTLDLWIRDIFKASYVRSLFGHVVDIIKIVKKSHILNAKYQKIAEETNVNTTLHLPAKTRWGSYLTCLQSFLKAKIILQTLVISSEGSRPLQRHKQKLLDDAVWSKLQELEEFLIPTVNWITKLEGDYSAVHLVHKAIQELTDVLRNPLTMMLLEDDYEQIAEKFFERRENALKPVHYAAAILNPKCQGVYLSTEDNLIGCELIVNLSRNDASRDVVNATLQELTNYKNREGLWQKDFVWQMAETVEPILWWQSLYSKTNLGKIALKVLSIPATSAAVERSFSTFSNIHTNKRNRLKTERAGKITFIAHNWKLINKTRTESTSSSSTEQDATIGHEDFQSLSEDEFSDAAHESDDEPVVVLEDDAMQEDDPLSFENENEEM